MLLPRGFKKAEYVDSELYARCARWRRAGPSPLFVSGDFISE